MFNVGQEVVYIPCFGPEHDKTLSFARISSISPKQDGNVTYGIDLPDNDFRYVDGRYLVAASPSDRIAGGYTEPFISEDEIHANNAMGKEIHYGGD